MAGERTIKVRFDGDVDGLRRATRSGSRMIDRFKRDADDNIGRIGVGMGGRLGNMFAAAFTSIPLSPHVLGALVAIGAILTPIIGTAVSAGILLGVGGGALATGIILAAQDPQVQSAWAEFGTRAKEALSGFSDAFEGPLIRAADILADSLERMEPLLTDIGNAMAPVIDELAPAFAEMIENALPGIKGAIEASRPLFDTIAAHMPAIGDAVGKFFAIIADAGPGAQLFLDHVLTALEHLIPAVALFLVHLSTLYVIGVNTFVAIGQAVLTFVATALRAFKSVVDVAAQIPGPHQDAMRKVSAAIGGAINKVSDMKRGLDNLKNPRTVDIRTEAAMERLRRLNDKIAAVVYDRTMGITVAVKGGGRITERAHGGPVRPGRTYLVGEEGPELLTMGGSGGHVFNNRQTRRMLGGRTGGVHVENLNVQAWTDRFSLPQIQDELAYHGAA